MCDGGVALLCHRTEDEEVQERGLAGRLGPEAHAAGVGAVVLHGHAVHGDADVPAVHVAVEVEAAVVALPVLHQPVEVARHSVNLAHSEGTASAPAASLLSAI